MRYTKAQIKKAIKMMSERAHDVIRSDFDIALDCMRDALLRMQETFETGDILYLGPNQFNSDWAIFLEYANEAETACYVLTITRHGYIGAAYWEVNEVEKTGHIDISGIESVLQTGEQG